MHAFPPRQKVNLLWTYWNIIFLQTPIRSLLSFSSNELGLWTAVLMGFASEPSWGFASSRGFPSGLHSSFLESLPSSFSAEILVYWRVSSHRDFIGSKIFKPCLYKDIVLLFCMMKDLCTHGITGETCLLYPKLWRGHLPLLASSIAALSITCWRADLGFT